MMKTMTMIQTIVTIFLIICVGNGYALVNHSPRTVIANEKDASGSGRNDVVEAPTSRRRAMIRLAGVVTATPILAASADPSAISSIQGPLQDVIAPGHWIGQFIGLNSKTEQWEFPSSSPGEVSSALVEVLNELTPERREKLLIPNFKVSGADANRVHVITWTKAEWLDSFDVKLKERGGGGCVATASFYATGFLPTSIPLAPLVNVGFAWFPFASPGPRGEMLQNFRLRAIRGLLDQKLKA